MKKIRFTFLALLAVLITVTVSSCSSSNDDDPSGTPSKVSDLSKASFLVKNHIKGSVKSISERTYEAVDKFGKITQGKPSCKGDSEEYATLALFDKGSNKTSELVYRANGTVWIKSTYTYDDNLNLVSKSESYDGENPSITTYTYDDNSNLISDHEAGEEIITYTYDDNLNAKIKHYDDGGERVYIYDSNLNLITETNHHADGTVSEKEVYTYDKNLNKIGESDYDYGTLEQKLAYTYTKFDKKGNWIEQIKYEDQKPIALTVRKIEYYNQ